jgi:ferredoxin
MARAATSRRVRRAAKRPLSVHRFRRVFQTAFLLLFLSLLTLTVWPVGSLFLGGFLLSDPLLAINSLANGVVKWELVLAIPVLLSPLFIGRAFCGYVCPMGFLVELFGPRRERHAGPRTRKILRRVPLFSLVVVVMLILMGSAVFLVFDPLSLFTRTATTLVYPALDRGLRLAGDILYQVPAFRGGVDAVTNVLTGRIVFSEGLAYTLQLVILLMFVIILAVSYFERRLWCRHLCPLGALLGLLGRGALFGRVVDTDKCTKCGACTAACSMDAIRDEGLSTDTSRCQGGLECVDACPTGAIRWGYRPRRQFEYDPSRRALLKGAGLAFIGSFFLFTGLGRIQRSSLLIRPPGARDEQDFLATCARCGQCMKVCPTNTIQPAVFTAGVEGFFTPELDFRRAYCDWSCNECGKVCPTQAIRQLSLDRKRITVIGRAQIDRSRCIPWAEGRQCLVCQELCPTPSKAIIFGPGDAVFQSGRVPLDATVAENAGSTDGAAPTAPVKLPYVAPELCIGCGICEFNCPVNNEAAIRVRSTAQTSPRSR